MYIKNYDILVDFGSHITYFPTNTMISFTDGDIGCKITAQLVSDKVPIDLTDSIVTVNVKIDETNSCTLICEIIDASTGYVEIDIPQVVNKPGENIFEIVIRNLNDTTSISKLLMYKITESIGAADVPTSELKLLIVDELISNVHKLDVAFNNGIGRIANLETSEEIRINNEVYRQNNEISRNKVFNDTISGVNLAIASGTVDLEVKGARVGKNGTVYTTLNERLNAIETNPYVLYETVEG